jgi:hypothetical protein
VFYRPLFYSFLLLLFSSADRAWGQGLTALDSASLWPPRVYVVLENAPFPIHHVQTQSTGHKTNTSGTITVEIYNLLVPATDIRLFIPTSENIRGYGFTPGDTLLVTLSALPDATGNVVWQPIDPDTVATRCRFSLPDVVRDGARRVRAYRQAGNPPEHVLTTRINLFPIVRKQGRYWAPGPFVLTQYFLIRPRTTSRLARADYVTINVKSPALSYDAPWRTMLALLPADGQYRYTRAMPIGIVREGTYRGVTECWSRPSIMISHPGLRYFGMEIFEYKTGVGVVSGRYAHYFQDFTPFFSRMFFDHVIIDGKTLLR